MYGQQEGLVAHVAGTVTIPPRTVQHVPIEVPERRKCRTWTLFIEPSSAFLSKTGLVSGVLVHPEQAGRREKFTYDLSAARRRQENDNGYCKNTGSHPVAP